MCNEVFCFHIVDFTTSGGAYIPQLRVFYQLFGKPLGTAPIVVVNHALTGNSQLTGKNGWWKDIIGENKVVNLSKYTVLAFNIPGNGFAGDESDLVENQECWTAVDVARIFNFGIEYLNISSVFALIGCSVGGGIAWEMAALQPKWFQNVIIVASDWKATDWIIGNCLLQELILKNSNNPLHDARLHAMLYYRTPTSLKMKFERSTNASAQLYNVETWLLHHGEKLQKRFSLSSYKLVNQLIKTVDISKGKGSFALAVADLSVKITIISVDSDLYYVPQENRDTVQELKEMGKEVSYSEIKSVHGHDAFLIEHEQLTTFLEPIFK